VCVGSGVSVGLQGVEDVCKELRMPDHTHQHMCRLAVIGVQAPPKRGLALHLGKRHVCGGVWGWVWGADVGGGRTCGEGVRGGRERRVEWLLG
jgi:hypothetical protein